MELEKHPSDDSTSTSARKGASSPHSSTHPFCIPAIQGRILIDGEIRTEGFNRKPVYTPCDASATSAASRASLPTSEGELATFTSNSSSSTSARLEIGSTPQVSVETFLTAVEAASRAWNQGRGIWPSARMEERIAAVSSFCEQMVQKRELVCRLLMWEIAKSWKDAQAEFDRTVQYIHDTLEATKQLDRDSSRIQFAEGILAQIRRMPLGVTLCMGPYNYPLNETFTTLIPALIMGNVVVAKLPRFGTLLWDPLLEAFRDCFPKGVINIVNGVGKDIIEPAVHTGNIDVLAFIGSSQVANQIKLAHPQPHHFRSILGLDAKNPALILPDADIPLAVSECVRGAFSFNGQRCTALKILFVHRSLSKAFTEALVQAVDQLTCGQPWDPGVSITPLPDPLKADQLSRLLQDALNRGARLSNPARGGKSQGSLFYPTVVSQVPLDCDLATQEQFGPILPIVEWESLSEFEDYVLHSPYGMQASVFGKDPKAIGAVIDLLSNQVCRINLNAQCQRGPDLFPFTGRKLSAEGTLSVTDALRSFSIRSMVAAKQDPLGKQVVKSVVSGEHSRFLNTNIVL